MSSVLGILPPNCPAPISMDEGLSHFDLTDEEAEALCTAREHEISASDAGLRILAVY